MSEKKRDKIRDHFSDSSRFVFLQFFIILLVVVTMILFTSVSFYQGIVESITAYASLDVIDEIREINPEVDSLSDKIHEIEIDNPFIIAIYEKADENDENYSKQIFSHEYEPKLDNSKLLKKDFLNFDYQKFINSEVRAYKGAKAGYYTNPVSNFEFFVVVKASQDNNTIYIATTPSKQINAQAKTISVSIIIVNSLTFIIVCFVMFMFFARITKPLKTICNVTKEMAETNDPKLRISIDKREIKTEVDDAADSVNFLYESLMLTKENLLEKTDILTELLKERDIEQKAHNEFIASTSHEFKTPIAIIQGYAEGAKFLSDDPQALNEYCDTIIDECVRMNNLVVNMMSLSSIQRSKALNYQDFSIKEFIAERFRLFDKTFEQKGITAENRVNDDIYGKADTEKLHFVINNLLSNAISYIGGKPKIIRARYEDMGIFYRIFIFNSGEHIPKAEIEKLWESFFRNDPARNRNEGHFGLGLSIVKAVQDAHSQACGVINADGGVEFWFDILK